MTNDKLKETWNQMHQPVVVVVATTTPITLEVEPECKLGLLEYASRKYQSPYVRNKISGPDWRIWQEYYGIGKYKKTYDFTKTTMEHV